MNCTSIDVGIRNMGLARLTYNHSLKGMTDLPCYIEELALIDFGKGYGVQKYVEKMVEYFLDNERWYNVEYVIIESQEVAQPLIRRLFSAVQAHFETLQTLYSFKVILSPANCKFKVYTGPTIKTTSSTIYHKRKELIVAQLNAILLSRLPLTDNEKNYIGWWLSLKKKDDVADAVMQGAYWINKLNEEEDPLMNETWKHVITIVKLQEPMGDDQGVLSFLPE